MPDAALGAYLILGQLQVRVLGQPLRQARPRHTHGFELNTQTYTPFFGPYNTHQPVPLGNTVTPVQMSGPSLWRTSNSGAASQFVPNSEQNMSHPSSNSHISLDEFTQLNHQLDYIDEHDKRGDIATCLVDDVLDNIEANETAAEAETRASEARTDSALHKYLLSVRKRLSAEIKK
ncbi:hypothetical protein C8R44DRAFT_752835 [Mycena epipterygia]|nr:hypothetical protein C8R44DRAFT_752835 [Mycena epipterygia]